jgi:4-amino-4-deoxy-L-arabinose transferase-like glycosyltransferase
MDEPSVLDYVLEKLAFWRKGELTIPPPDESEKPPRTAGVGKKLWKVILPFIPLVFALIAQTYCEPEYRTPLLVIFFYLAAAGSLVLLMLLRNWQIDSLEPDEGEAADLKLRWPSFLAGILISLLAFLFFIANTFNLINLTLWITGLVLIWRSLRVPGAWKDRIVTAWNDFWQGGLVITPWMVLVALVFLVCGFYRLYLLNQVPPEMFSDHAEKLLDVTDVLNGQYSIFFPRNTGREAFQMYLTAAVAKVFGTGISFLSLKLGTCLMGLFSLPFIYLLGKEIKNREVGLMAMFFAGIAYWPNVIARVALRFILYPAFAAPTLYFLVRGLKRKSWNDFLLAGLFLGLGLHGYSPFRIMPLVVFLVMLVYFLHTRSTSNRRLAVIGLAVMGLISLVIFLPLLRFALSHYDLFASRMLTRMTDAEHPLPGSPLQILFSNLGKALIMFQWDNGQIWVHSIPGRPALGVVAAALFSLGIVLLIARYIKGRHWIDLALLLSIPLLLLPSALSIAFPDENPSLNRSGGAIIPVFLVIAFALENLVVNIRSYLQGRSGRWVSVAAILVLAAISLRSNYQLVFDQYYQEFKMRAWNTSEIGRVIRQFSDTIGSEDQVWVVPYPHWVDTRLVGIRALGYVRDYALWPPDIHSTVGVATPKLYIYKPEDEEALQTLQELYPGGMITRFQSAVEGRDFMLYYVLQ